MDIIAGVNHKPALRVSTLFKDTHNCDMHDTETRKVQIMCDDET